MVIEKIISSVTHHHSYFERYSEYTKERAHSRDTAVG